MDADEEAGKFKLMLFVLIAFIVSTFFAYMELKYSTGGRTAEATVDRVAERAGRRRTTRTVYYHYRDTEGNLRNGSDDVDPNWFPPDDGKVMVQYLADTSRLAGKRNTFALVVFFGSLAAMLVGGFLFWRHVREATRPSPKPYSVPRRY